MWDHVTGLDVALLLAILAGIYITTLWGLSKSAGCCYSDVQQTSHSDEVYDWERDGL